MSEAFDARVLEDRRLYRIVRCGPLLASSWWGPVTMDALTRLESHEEAMVRAHPDGVALMSVIDVGGVGIPTDEVRAFGAELMRRFAEQTRCMAHVIPGRGLRKSAIRAILSMMQLTSRANVKSHVFDDVPGGLAWIAQHGPTGSAALTRSPLALELSQRLEKPLAGPSEPEAHP